MKNHEVGDFSQKSSAVVPFVTKVQGKQLDPETVKISKMDIVGESIVFVLMQP